MNNAVKTLAAAAALALTTGTAFAQTQTTTPLPAKKPGILSRLFHPKPKPGMYQSNGSAMHPMNGQPVGRMGAGSYGTMGSHSMMGGPIIGNKNSHVYHMAGDKGSLPAPQNRVYFSSAAAAQAAGYHAAGGSRGMTTNSRSMMHGGMMTH